MLQFGVTGILLYYAFQAFSISPDVTLSPNLQLHIIPAVYIIIMMLFIVGSANAVNFTDGLDGLLIVAAIPTYFFFFIIAEHLEVKTFALVMVGCLLGLLLYNSFPAKAFMGDTGSLAIGGSLAFMAVIEKVEIRLGREQNCCCFRIGLVDCCFSLLVVLHVIIAVAD